MKTTTSAKQNPAAQFVRRSHRLARLWAAVLAAPAGSKEREAKWSKAS